VKCDSLLLLTLRHFVSSDYFTGAVLLITEMQKAEKRCIVPLRLIALEFWDTILHTVKDQAYYESGIISRISRDATSY